MRQEYYYDSDKHSQKWYTTPIFNTLSYGIVNVFIKIIIVLCNKWKRRSTAKLDYQEWKPKVW